MWAVSDVDTDAGLWSCSHDKVFLLVAFHCIALICNYCFLIVVIYLFPPLCLQCFDAVGWVTGRASGL